MADAHPKFDVSVVTPDGRAYEGEAEMLMETDPDTFWQAPHYAGSKAVLIRYSSDDPERVRYVIERAYELAASLKPVKPRKTK